MATDKHGLLKKSSSAGKLSCFDAEDKTQVNMNQEEQFAADLYRWLQIVKG